MALPKILNGNEMIAHFARSLLRFKRMLSSHGTE